MIRSNEFQQKQSPKPSDQQQQQQKQPQSQNQEDSNSKPKRNPFCSRCRNHGKSAQVKGHKRHCEYRYCQCEGCHLVEMRQIVSARQIKRRRNQKQDEECGRSIEVSPPVLTREPASNLASLIAKTLTIQQQNVVNDHAAHQHQQHQNAASLTANQPPLQHQPLNQHSPQQEHQLNSSNSPVSSALSNALHLFHFPHSFTGQPPGVIIPPISTASSAASAASAVAAAASSAASPPLPSYREQLTLVEEIYNSFGPLAIYAWLKAEQFNLRKVHESIKTSQASYHNLLDLKSKYNLHPHHFLPHFVHHPFGAHHQTHHQHYLHQVNPAQLSTVNNLSPSTTTSSLSTVL